MIYPLLVESGTLTLSYEVCLFDFSLTSLFLNSTVTIGIVQLMQYLVYIFMHIYIYIYIYIYMLCALSKVYIIIYFTVIGRALCRL